jgi:CheY-like chemotaxis protein
VSKRVLIVEDNELNLKLIKVLLHKKAYEVDEAHDGEEALKKIQNNKYDLILMDIQIPKIDGYEVTRRARKMPGKEKTPIIALTAYARSTDKENAMSAGCDYYISKPINTRTFIADIEKVMERNAKANIKTDQNN